ncbi:MAG: hypothetical protein WBK77_06525 [Alphaproteobacteria bacterium]
MTSEIDIYRAAKVLLDKHGSEAIQEAQHRYEELLACGNEEGARLWQKIVKATEWIQTDAKRTGETSH